MACKHAGVICVLQESSGLRGPVTRAESVVTVDVVAGTVLIVARLVLLPRARFDMPRALTSRACTICSSAGTGFGATNLSERSHSVVLWC